MNLAIGDNPDLILNGWSFSQLCRLAGVHKDTLNRLSPKTASRVLQETLPRGEKPWQILTAEDTIRSIHGVNYTRLWNDELLTMLQEFASDFQPPQPGVGGGTGLYCGEQDLFCFLIDPLGWTEIDGEAFAPGMFVWNSEVGRRTLGIQTFWFQAVCQNHLVWDAVEVVEFSRKHTANVRDGLDEIRFLVADLVKNAISAGTDSSKVVRKAMCEKLGDGAEEAMKKVSGRGHSHPLGAGSHRKRPAAGPAHDFRGRRCPDADFAARVLRRRPHRAGCQGGRPPGAGGLDPALIFRAECLARLSPASPCRRSVDSGLIGGRLRDPFPFLDVEEFAR